MPQTEFGRLLAPPGRKLALMAVLAALCVATPMTQVWRQHARDLVLLSEAGAALQPLEQAVLAQRSLFGHRGLAASVLRGRVELESQRQAHQQQVQGALQGLTRSLQARGYQRAQAEADAAGQGFAELVEQLLARNIAVAASDEAHALLVEQMLVVMDLLGEPLLRLGALEPPVRAAIGEDLHATLLGLARLQAGLEKGSARAIQGFAVAGAGKLPQRSAARIVARLEEAARGEPALARAAIALRLRFEALAAAENRRAGADLAPDSAADLAVLLEAARDALLTATREASSSLASRIVAARAEAQDGRQWATAAAAVPGLLALLFAVLWLRANRSRSAGLATTDRLDLGDRSDPASGQADGSSGPESRAFTEALVDRLRRSRPGEAPGGGRDFGTTDFGRPGSSPP